VSCFIPWWPSGIAIESVGKNVCPARPAPLPLNRHSRGRRINLDAAESTRLLKPGFMIRGAFPELEFEIVTDPQELARIRVEQ
jgi:hypothetical protein